MYLSIIRLGLIICFLTACQPNQETKIDKVNSLAINELIFSPDGFSLAYTSTPKEDTDVVVNVGSWDIKSGKVQRAKKVFRNHINTLFFSPEGESLALMYDMRYSHFPLETKYGFIWHIERNEVSNKLSYMPDYLGPEAIITVSPDKRFTAQPDLKGRIRLWNNVTKKIVKTYQIEHLKVINAMQFSFDNKRLVVIGKYDPPYNSKDDKYKGPTLVVAIDLSDKKENIILDTESYFVGFKKKNHHLITRERASDTIKIWDSFKQTFIQEIDYVGSPFFIKLSNNGRFMVAVINASLIILPENKAIEMEKRHVVVVWDIKTGQPIHVLTTGTRATQSLAISPDNKTLATGSDKGVIRLWNMNTGELIKHIVVNDFKQ